MDTNSTNESPNTSPHISFQSKQDGNHLSPLVAASISGFVSRLLLHPTDTIKIRILNQKQFEIDKYKGFSDAFKRMYTDEGVLAFYRGLAPSLFLAAPAQAVYLSSYDYSKVWIGNMLPTEFQNSFLVHFLAGLSAETLSCFFWVPHDMIKERMQVDKFPNLSRNKDLKFQQEQMRGHFFKTVNVIRKEGLLNIYKGYWITLFSYAPLSGFYFLAYEKLKEFARKFRQLESNDDLQLYPDILFCSIFGISFAAILTQPFDLVKTRYQIQRRMDSEHAYKNSLDGFRKIIKYEGPHTLWKGTGARLIYTAPNAALIMVLYEYFKHI